LDLFKCKSPFAKTGWAFCRLVIGDWRLVIGDRLDGYDVVEVGLY
jgi:hypothetical protein